MAWADLADTSQSTTSTLAAGQQTYYDQKFLQQAIPNLHMMQFAEKRKLPRNEGKTITFYRYNALDVVTSGLTEGTNPSATAVDDHTVTRTIKEWGAWHQYSSLVSLTTIDTGLKDQAKLFGTQAGKSIDLRIMKEVVTCGSHSMSVAGAASGAGERDGQWHGSDNGTTASTAALIHAHTGVLTGDLLFDDSDNWYIGGQITFTEGQNYGQTRYVYDSVAADYSCLMYPSFEFAPADGDAYLFTHPGKSGAQGATADVLAASDVITHGKFAMAREDLQTFETPEFDGGYFIFLIGPTTNRGFMSDTAGGWMGLAQYRGQALYRGEIGKYMGFRVVQTTQPFRCVLPTNATTGGPGATSNSYEATGTNYAKGGAGHYSLAFGKGAFGVTLFPGWNSPKFIYNPLGSAGAADPLKMQGTVGWKLPFVPCALNALWCVSVVSGG